MKKDPGAVGRPLVIGGGLLIAAWLFWDGRDFWPPLIGSGFAQILGQLLRWGALALLLAGATFLFVSWRRWRGTSPEPLPKEFRLVLLIPAALILVYALMHMSETMVVVAIVMPIPVLIAVLTVRRSWQTHRAARWTRGSARITRSEIQERHHRSRKDVTQVTNVPVVQYEFAAGAQTIHSDRVCFGDAGPTPEAVLKRYPAGASVPVFYDPANPSECVLEREAPVPMGCIWAIAATALLVGAAAVLSILHLTEIDTMLTKYFPPGGQPIFTIVFGGCGLLMLMMIWAGIHQTIAASRWPAANGQIVSSRVESFRTRVGGANTGQMVTFYQAVVEYSYHVEGSEYHGTRLSFGAQQSSAEGPAKKRAARYPDGTKVQVRYDPADPSQAVLEARVALNWLLILVTLVFLGVAVVFSGLIR